jgi:hypothetical protein
MGMTACGAGETELPFETIERSDYGDYSIREPRVVLVTNRQEIDQLKGLISQAALDQLAELDFQQYFAIAVFRGTQATSGYDVIVERVARRGDKIVIRAQFWEPSPHWEILNEVTSPYHLIKMRRDDGVSQETELVLQSPVVTPTPPF